MIYELIIAIIFGVFCGIITGLIPGIHINLISLLLLSLSPILLNYTNPIILSVFIISMSTTHSFLDFIPSVFLGAPDADTALSILPGHKLLLEGKAFEAIKLTVIGSLGALILAIVMIPITITIFPLIYLRLKDYIGYLLIFIMLFMILKDKKRKWNFVVFLLSGVLGLIVLNMPNLNNPLFAMLSGLFGVSMLVISIKDKVNIPEQSFEENIIVDKKTTFKALLASTLAGSLTGFFPGLGAAQGAVIAQQFTKEVGDYGFMILVGGINTVNFVLSLITLYTIDKARNGAVIVVSELIESIGLNRVILMIFICSALITGGIATFLALKITKIFAKIIVKVNYQILILSILSLIIGLTFYFSSWIGLIILFTSTMIGIIPAELGVGRNHAMGCLILPVIIYLTL